MLVKRKGNVYIRCNKLVELYSIYKFDLLKGGCLIIGTVVAIITILIIGELV